MGSYGETVQSTVLSSLPLLFLYQLPTVIFIFLIKKLDLPHRTAGIIRSSAALLALCIVFNFAHLHVISISEDLSYLYNEGYEFTSSAKELGLITTLKLEAFRKNVENIPLHYGDTTSSQESHIYVTQNFNVIEGIFDRITSENSPPNISQLNELASTRIPSDKNEKTGIFKDKNLIFVCAEALSPYAVSEKLTPTLYKLMQEGFNFTNYYSPTFGESTSGGEYTLLQSQIPKRQSGEKGLTMQLSARNTLPYSLPAMFRSNGYSCNGYHNNSYTYYSRNVTHPAMGLNWYGCGGCVKVDENAESFDLSTVLSSGWPRSDRELIKATANRFINSSKDTGTPFFTYYLTVSGHNNYSFSGNKMSAKNREYTDALPYSTTVKAYLSAQKELDLALEELLNVLEEQGILENTVIAIANDHHPYGLSPTWSGNNNTDHLSELYEKKLTNRIDTEKGFFTVYCRGHKGEEINQPVSSIDVLPTLLNLFGIEYDSRLLCGKDAFSSGERLVFFSDGSFVTDRGRFDANIPLQCQLSNEYIAQTKNKIRSLMQFSLSLRKTDFFSYLFQKG